jgi:hypothetical protein
MVRRPIASKIFCWKKRSASMYTASEGSAGSASSHDGIRTHLLLITPAVSISDRVTPKDQGGSVGPVLPSLNLRANLV